MLQLPESLSTDNSLFVWKFILQLDNELKM